MPGIAREVAAGRAHRLHIRLNRLVSCYLARELLLQGDAPLLGQLGRRIIVLGLPLEEGR